MTVAPALLLLFCFALGVSQITWCKDENNKGGYDPLNLENGSFLNRDIFDTTDLRFQ